MLYKTNNISMMCFLASFCKNTVVTVIMINFWTCCFCNCSVSYRWIAMAEIAFKEGGGGSVFSARIYKSEQKFKNCLHTIFSKWLVCCQKSSSQQRTSARPSNPHSLRSPPYVTHAHARCSYCRSFGTESFATRISIRWLR